MRFFGDVAIVRALGSWTAKSGKPGTSRYIDVYVRSGEDWKVVSAQITITQRRSTLLARNDAARTPSILIEHRGLHTPRGQSPATQSFGRASAVADLEEYDDLEYFEPHATKPPRDNAGRNDRHAGPCRGVRLRHRPQYREAHRHGHCAHRNHTDCRGDRPQWLLQSVDRYDDAEWPRVGELPSGGGIGDGHESDRRYALYRDRLGKSRQSFVKEDLILMRENTHAAFLEIGFAGWRFCSRSPS